MIRCMCAQPPTKGNKHGCWQRCRSHPPTPPHQSLPVCYSCSTCCRWQDACQMLASDAAAPTALLRSTCPPIPCEMKSNHTAQNCISCSNQAAHLCQHHSLLCNCGQRQAAVQQLFVEPAPAALPWPLGVYAECIQHHGNAGKPTEGWLILRAVPHGKAQKTTAAAAAA